MGQSSIESQKNTQRSLPVQGSLREFVDTEEVTHGPACPSSKRVHKFLASLRTGDILYPLPHQEIVIQSLLPLHSSHRETEAL